MIKLDSIEEFENAIKEEESLFILKHSTTCPISKAAYDEYQKFNEAYEEVPAFYLTVQDSRPLSNHIAESFEIKHESPQAILFSNHNLAWSASHWNITKKSLEEALEKIK